MEKEKDMFEYKKDDCEVLQGNVIDIDLKKDDCEVRADIRVKRKNCVRIWGRVMDCYGEPVEEALVKLLKKAHTITDCEGFYQFDVCDEECKAEYRVIVSKAATGKDRVIYDEGECEPCYKDHNRECEKEEKD